MNTSRLRLSLLFASLAFVSFGSAFANPIAVNNASFETLPPGGLPNGCGTDCFYSADAIPGWTGGLGQFQPGPPATTAYYNYVPNGVTVAYTSPGSPISQAVGTLVAGDIYTLTLALGTRKDTGFGSAAELLIDGTRVALATGVPASPGDWAYYTATYRATGADAGKSLEIVLFSTGNQGNFDDVALDATTDPVPEPSSIALLGTGLLGLAGAARRKFLS